MTQDLGVKVIQDPDDPDGLVLDLGPELCQQLGWMPGDNLVWTDNKDGSWTITKMTN